MHRLQPMIALLVTGCIPGLSEQTSNEYGLINGSFACQIETNIDADVALGVEVGTEWGLEDCRDEQFHLEGMTSGYSCVDVAAVMSRNDVIRQCSQAD